MAQPTVTWSVAQGLQRELEHTLLELERLGLLREASADEIRIIVAEDIANRFGERYRAFPCGPRPDALQIRRDAVPAQCVLAAGVEARLRAARQQIEVESAASSQAAAAPPKPFTKKAGSHKPRRGQRYAGRSDVFHKKSEPAGPGTKEKNLAPAPVLMANSDNRSGPSPVKKPVSSPGKTTASSSSHDVHKPIKQWIANVDNDSSGRASSDRDESGLATSTHPAWDAIFSKSSSTHNNTKTTLKENVPGYLAQRPVFSAMSSRTSAVDSMASSVPGIVNNKSGEKRNKTNMVANTLSIDEAIETAEDPDPFPQTPPLPESPLTPNAKTGDGNSEDHQDLISFSP